MLHRFSEYGSILAYAEAENIIALLNAIHIFIGVRMHDLHKLNQTASNGGGKTAWPPALERRLA